MKAPAVPMPRSLRNLRRDRRGFPIPFIVEWQEGKPLFAVIDSRKWHTCVAHGLCALCGGMLRDYHADDLSERSAESWWIGGTLCAQNRIFYDPAMCEGCARYSVQACPYLAMAGYSRHTWKPDPAKGISQVMAASDQRPDRFMLGRSGGYSLIQVKGEPLIHSRPWTTLEWWKDGKPLEGTNAQT